MVRYLDEYEEQCERCKHECSIEGMSGCIICKGFVPMTNGDRIRAMSDEELAEVLMKQCSGRVCPLKNCFDCWLDWLREEAT